ncbi:MAG: 50S ribosomal protein L11 methyltransferase, partial [Eubacteriales bacterium]|nr:50S ribosomal protein L11 methyltransferase [Eubacteriales bacterium]
DRLADVRARMKALGERAGAGMGALTVEVKTLDDEDWAENWKRQYKPFRLGEHMVIKPGWCAYEAQPGDKIIEIDPGLAFGTGTHETTALCVALVEQYVKPGDRVIDVGTGTGILAIAAARSGAAAVLASDIDPMAVKVAAENVRVNGLAHVIEARPGNLLEAVDEVCDVLTANIIADVIVQLAAPVRAHIREGGVFICSGIARERQQAVLDALKAAGYHDIDVREQGEWAAIACRR